MVTMGLAARESMSLDESASLREISSKSVDEPLA